MNDLEAYFHNNQGRLIHKWQHYFAIYDRHFSRFRGTDVHVVEFGVSQGGSLQMWKSYFGPDAHIHGVDINPHCKSLEEDRVSIYIGDQEDRVFLRSLAEKIPRIDILIDDGGHTMRQQINTFEELYPSVSANGVYLCEDIHTSYWPEEGGGFKRKSTFIEYSKNFIDIINAWHSRTPRLKVSEMTRSTDSAHFYCDIVVLEKAPIEPPQHHKTGEASIPAYQPQLSLWRRISNRLRRLLYRWRGV